MVVLRSTLVSLVFAGTLFAAVPIPDGLCWLQGKEGGYGQGFVVGNLLFSTAHVLENADGVFRCYQGGALVDLAPSQRGTPRFHPRWKNEARARGEEFSSEIPFTEWETTALYDCGYVPIDAALRSDFRLEGATTMLETLPLEPLPRVVAHVDESGAHARESAKGVFPLSQYFDGQKVRYSGFSASSKPVHFLLHYEWLSVPGMSGSPLGRWISPGTFLVEGLLVGGVPQFRRPPGAPEYYDVVPSYFTAAQNLARWMATERPELFVPSCAQALAGKALPAELKETRK